MGTRGLVVIYYRNKCYTFYNHWDSYFDVLGKILVNNLIELLKNPEKLEELKNVFSKMNTLNDKIENFNKENVKSIYLPKWENLSEGQNIFLELLNDLNELINDNCVNITTKYYEDLARSMGCEWTYVLDLDYEKFSIKSIGDELCISNIPLDITKLEGLIKFYES